ncbi:MAG: FAD-dependent oxidoreductase, partial [Proteobacteria bacterium]|nr:FAD-dependent oxidoreductase [Pseudomonadota bacterium]
MTVNRLQEPFGLVLDRAQSKAFQFDGRNYVGHPGDTLASALAANDVWCLSQSAKGGRPLGLFSLASAFRPCRVDVQGNLAVDPEDQFLFDGMCVNGLGEKPLRKNWLKCARNVFSGLTVQSRRQSQAPKIWAMERRFGFSSFTNSFADERPARRRRHTTEVAIVGGGPSGVAAAIEAARLGKKVTLVERLPLLGGSLNFMRLDVDSEVGEVLATQLAEELSAVEENLTVLLCATCREITPDRQLKIDLGRNQLILNADQVILATGVSERNLIFPNNDLPGVMSSAAVGQLMWLYGVRPGRRAVVVA